MRNKTKRIMAFLCAMVLVVGNCFAGHTFSVDASNAEAETEWYFLNSASDSSITITTTYVESTGLYGKYSKAISNASISLPDTVSKDTLALYIKMDIADQNALDSVNYGYFELCQNTCDQAELNWKVSNQSLNLTTGINEITLPLSNATNYPGSNNVAFDLGETVNYFRMYSNYDSATASTSVILYEVKLIDITEMGLEFGDNDTYLQLSEPLAQAPVSIEASVKMDEASDAASTPVVDVTENVSASALTNNSMIFSNTGADNETENYALFVTSDGYPAILWGTTQYTLNQNVCTGNWVDISVVKDTDGYINFYLDGVFVAKSTVAETDVLSAPVTAHCIGADGIGGQVFNGRLGDVRVWSDTRTSDEIAACRIATKLGCSNNGLDSSTEGLMGSWFLLGDIQYILKTMPDVSVNNNTAVYCGTRAQDWVDYDMNAALDYIGEDYWSMVFIPDIQELTTGMYTDYWYTMAQWIAENVGEDKENIKHVTGAGDSTWNDLEAEYERARAGFDLFTGLVSWSNMTGNHDYPWYVTGTSGDERTARDVTDYNTYFGADYIANTKAAETYVGTYDDPEGVSGVENSYYRFSVNDVNWMILQLEYFPRQGVLDWADGILKQYPDDHVVLTTHSYIDQYGNYNTETRKFINEDAGQLDNTGSIWTALKDNANIELILCGHASGIGAVAQKIETNDAGETVPALMINAQSRDYGSDLTLRYYTDQPLGMLGILRFSNDGSKVALQYYAPNYDKSFSPEDVNGNRDSNNIKLNLEQAVRDWTIISEDTTAATRVISKSGMGVDLSAYYDANSATEGHEDLKLYLLVTLDSNEAVETMQHAWVELGNDSQADYYEISWKFETLADDLDLHVGTNALCLSLAPRDATSNLLGSTNKSSVENGTFSLQSSINWFRIYTSETYQSGWSDITVNEVKIVDITPCVEKYSSATPGVAPTPTSHVPVDYVFAGWYTDEACTSVLTKAVTNGEAYAKFVDGDVLTVKAQYKKTLTEGAKSLPFDSESAMSKKNGSTSYETVDKNGENVEVLKKTGNSNVRFKVLLTDAVDISAYSQGYLEFDMYINDLSYIQSGDAEAINEVCYLRLGSNGYDGSCMQYNGLFSELAAGWKTYRVSLADFGTQQYADYSKIHLINFYFPKATSADLVMMLDNVHVVTDATNLRLITTVDSDMYQNVGFDITIGDKTISTVSDTVYTELYGVDSTDTILAYAPKIFSVKSEYFNTYTLGNVPISDKEIVITPYWTTLDGTKVTGTSRTIIMSEVVSVE